jgi:hypothetical protein
MGFLQPAVTQEEIENTVTGAMNNVFKPEFLARIDEICVYNKLSKADLLRVVGTEVEHVKDRIVDDLPRGTQFELRVDASAQAFLLEQALVTGDNARDIRRICDKLLTDCLGNEMIKGNIPLGALVEVVHEANEPALAFYVSEGAGHVSAADLLAWATGNETGVSLQRGIERARYELKRGVATIDRYVINVPLKRDKNPMEEALGLIQDIRNIFELEVLKWSVGLKPAFIEVEVFMTSAFEPQIKKVYKTATIKKIDGQSSAAAQ